MLFMQPTIRSLNEFEFTSDTCIGYTRKGEMFVVDLDMFDRIILVLFAVKLVQLKIVYVKPVHINNDLWIGRINIQMSIEKH